MSITIRREYCPLGLTEGILPVLLCIFLQVYSLETTFYREGTFVPEPGIADWELLLRRPEMFSVAGCRVTGERQVVVERLAAGLKTEPTVVAVIRGLLRMTQGLPEFSHKTQRIPETTRRLRKALASAKSPEQLLFTDLPKALNLSGLFVSEFFDALNEALREWSQVFPNMVNESRDRLLEACGFPTGNEGWGQLRQEARKLESHLGFAPTALVPFLRRAALPGDTETSIENVLAQVGDRPPRTWDDATIRRFQDQAGVIGELFREMVAQSGSLTEPVLTVDESVQRDELTAAIREHLPPNLPPRLLRATLLTILRELPQD